MYSASPRTEQEVRTLFRKFHFICKHEDGHSHESISWSEWLVLIASKTQLNRKNMVKVFQFLDYKTNDL